MRTVVAAALLVVFAVPHLTAPPPLVTRAEPKGSTTPPPQAAGALGAEGIDMEGVLDPGDRDGFSFTVSSDGPLAATVEAAPGASFLVSLAREGADGPVGVASVMGAAPLTLAVPLLEAGAAFRIGVAALDVDAPLPYTLALRREAVLPGWSGEICGTPTPSAEPDGYPLAATDLGFFTGVLCGSGALDAVVVPGGEGEGDEDHFRFRNVLPVPARLRFTTDPGLIRVEAQAVVFVGVQPFAAASFGEEGTLDLPALAPGSDYVIRVGADQGTAPLSYSFVLEPVAPPPGPEPEPLTVTRARVRLDPAGTRASFSVDGVFAAGTGLVLDASAPFAWSLRGAGQEFAAGLLTRDSRGRLVHRGLPGAPGLRLLRFDPVRGRVHLRGKGLGFASDATDPSLDLLLTLGDLELAADPDGAFNGSGRVLVVKPAE